MTIKQAIKELNWTITKSTCCAEVLRNDYSDDTQQLLHGVETEVEALRMAKRALEEKPRWIPCGEQMPSDENKVLCCTQLCFWTAWAMIYRNLIIFMCRTATAQ